MILAKNDKDSNRFLGDLSNYDVGAGSLASSKLTSEEIKEMTKGKILAIVENKPGEMACHILYKNKIKNPNATKVLGTYIRFSPRKSIERAESMGADKIMAAGE